MARHVVAPAPAAASTVPEVAGSPAPSRAAAPWERGARVAVLVIGAAFAASAAASLFLLGLAFRASPPNASVLWRADWVLPLLEVVFWSYVLVAGLIDVNGRRRDMARHLAATRSIEKGDESGADVQLAGLDRSRTRAFRELAQLTRAQLAEKRGDWAAVVVACDRGLAGGTRRLPLMDMAVRFVLPELVTLRAMGLAALRKHDDAMAELSVLSAELPLFPMAVCARFRAQLVSAVTRGDLDAAASVAASRTLDMSTSLRDDMLADLVLATTRGADPRGARPHGRRAPYRCTAARVGGEARTVAAHAASDSRFARGGGAPRAVARARRERRALRAPPGARRAFEGVIRGSSR